MQQSNNKYINCTHEGVILLAEENGVTLTRT